VTSTELDDILKLTFPADLTTKRLKPIFKEFASIQNRILIDYKKFRDKLLGLLGKFKEAEEIKKQHDEAQVSFALRKRMIADKICKMIDSRNQGHRKSMFRKSIDSLQKASMTDK
jgi:zona occludens toxin (predicted ATPase)